MGEQDYATRDDVNGVGRRVTDLALECAACKAKTEQRGINQDMRLEGHHVDIGKIFDKIDVLAKTQNRGIGIMITLNGFIVIAGILLEHFWK